MLDPDQAADLAARTLAAIDAGRDDGRCGDLHAAADRERAASDLAGLRLALACLDADLPWQDDHARRYADGLRRTAALYGVEL